MHLHYKTGNAISPLKAIATTIVLLYTHTHTFLYKTINAVRAMLVPPPHVQLERMVHTRTALD